MPKGFSLDSTLFNESDFCGGAISKQLLAENECGGKISRVREGRED